MGRVLKHCFPDRKLDVSELRYLLSQLENNVRNSADAVILPVLPRSSTETIQSNTVARLDSERLPAQEGVVLEEIATLHEDLGCMLRDSKGDYRK